ncbi:hypothetical protein EDD37DRAFT_319687 [Exophiala viscosa]|uniref:uncharacterized protein n=1 Tax=Exophiala viscosa TaxID=2486360 RepID=UPI00219B725E|nr:hypothetical protein EDD37DRAFT_319687 [Exophiala viscosa]
MKRQRPVTSCLSCRRRRLRCDRTHPSCHRCRTGGVQCIYDESAIPDSFDRSTAAAEPSRRDQSRPLAPQNEPQSPVVRPRSHETGAISVHAGGRSTYIGLTYWANPIPPEFNDNQASDGEAPTHASSPFPQWPPKQDVENPWAGLKFRPPRSYDVLWTKAGSNKCKLCGKRYNISCIMALLPTKEVCEKLCSLFFTTVFPLMPLLHARGFEEDFTGFWNGMSARSVHNSEPSLIMRQKPSFLCLLASVLFAASASATKSRVKSLLGDEDVPDTKDLYFIAMVSATLTGFPRQPSIYSLAAYILAQSQFVREEEFSDAPDFISTSFRVALETRRRLWHYICHLDVMSSSSSGLSPLFIDDKMANTDPMSQYDLLENEVGFDREVDIRYKVASQRYEITKEIRNILKCHFEDHFQSLDHVNDVARELRAVADRARISTETLLNARSSYSALSAIEARPIMTRPFARVWKLRPDANDAEVGDFLAWAALLVHLMVHKAYCVLYRPLFRDPSLGSHEVIRSNAVKNAQAFIQLFIRVCNDPISEPFHWMYPGTYQPLQAVSLLLADLLQHPYSDDASLSRGLIDAIFELYQVDEGIVSQNDPPIRQLSPSGRDAWAMLVRTRRKALEQTGVDHHVLYPSSLVSSSTCICGERIAHDITSGPGSQQHWSSHHTPGGGRQDEAAPDPLSDDQDPAGLSLGILGQMDFDWHAWDNALGPSEGMMP